MADTDYDAALSQLNSIGAYFSSVAAEWATVIPSEILDSTFNYMDITKYTKEPWYSSYTAFYNNPSFLSAEASQYSLLNQIENSVLGISDDYITYSEDYGPYSDDYMTFSDDMDATETMGSDEAEETGAESSGPITDASKAASKTASTDSKSSSKAESSSSAGSSSSASKSSSQLGSVTYIPMAGLLGAIALVLL